MLILLGKTASGKDTIAKKLVSDYGYERIITYTTRPMRANEVNGRDYYFIEKDEFIEKIKNNFFLEYKIYHTLAGDWLYGTAKKDFFYDENSIRKIVILTPDGYVDYLSYPEAAKTSNVAILVKANSIITKLRLKKRGDNKYEIKRRLKHDKQDFHKIDKIVNAVVNNNGSSDESIDNVVKKIFKLHMKGELKNESIS